MYCIIRNKKSDALTLHASSCPVAIKHYTVRGKNMIEVASFPTRFEAIESVEFHGGKVKECACAKVKSNPANRIINGNHRDVKKAAKLYAEFREAKPKRGAILNIDWPKTLMSIGNLRFIGYDTTIAGKTQLFKHDFAQGSRPILCADDKGQLFIVAGRYEFKTGKLNGIVDQDSRGRDIDDGT